MHNNNILLKVYNKLYYFFGPQHWWPADGSFEVMVGAVLTQNANWRNVTKAIENLKSKRLLSVKKISSISGKELIEAIRPAGFYRQKYLYLRNLSAFIISRYGGDLARMGKADTLSLRHELLAIKGIGPETADSILLYALNKTVFVVDAYTKRVFGRHGLGPTGVNYGDWQKYFMSHLPAETELFNEYHALIVKLAKEYCRVRPMCQGCPLDSISRTKL